MKPLPAIQTDQSKLPAVLVLFESEKKAPPTATPMPKLGPRFRSKVSIG